MEGNYPGARERERGKTVLGWLGSVAMLLQGAREREKERMKEGGERKSGEGG